MLEPGINQIVRVLNFLSLPQNSITLTSEVTLTAFGFFLTMSKSTILLIRKTLY